MKKIRIKANYKRIVLPNTIWVIGCAILILLTMLSAVLTVQAYQEPTITEETSVALTYSANSRYNYVVDLTENTVYDNKTTLRPGEGNIFKNIVDNITATFSFTFQSSETASITATYSTKAIIQTDLWSKTYTVLSTKKAEVSMIPY